MKSYKLKKVSYYTWNNLNLEYKDGKYIILDKTQDIETEMSQDDFVDYLTEHGENIHDATDIATTLQEEGKMAELIKSQKDRTLTLFKQAAAPEIMFEADAVLRVYFDQLELTISDKIRSILMSTISDSQKQIQIKQEVYNMATEKLIDAFDEINREYGITVDYNDLVVKLDHLNWESLLKPDNEV